MKNNDFLLGNKTAEFLYDTYAKELPIIDPLVCSREKALRSVPSNVTELMPCINDALVIADFDNRYIETASDYDRFREFCAIMPSLIGNPIYTLSHLFLHRYFGLNLPLNRENCDKIWDFTADEMSTKEKSAKEFLRENGVALICISKDPSAALGLPQNSDISILPTFYPEKLMNIGDKGIREYITELGESCATTIKDVRSLENALEILALRFKEHGCKSTVHKIQGDMTFIKPDEYHADVILKKAIDRNGDELTNDEMALFRCEMMYILGRIYKKLDLVMQLDIRDASSCVKSDLSALLAFMNEKGVLPRTVISGGALHGICIPQSASALSDCSIDRMRDQIIRCAELGALGNSLGLISGSDIFTLPFRHDVFRRVLCNTLGRWVEEGIYEGSINDLAQLISDICYNNVKNFFGFKL
ncbi:MAG: glucuronate isomerase [Ruminococcaceae bacterium]|nr:glucuronate isomerase [Oscillospiraceae bacterium]